YFESKKKALDRRTYDMINGKWKTMRPNVARFCGTYANVMHMVQESRAADEDYYNRALLNYEAEQGMHFTLCHCWEVLKGSPKWMETEVPKFLSSSFNTESEDANINLNVDVGNDEEDAVHEV
nr:hypothetical protein [Tanacetum cinerariifolium]